MERNGIQAVNYVKKCQEFLKEVFFRFFVEELCMQLGAAHTLSGPLEIACRDLNQNSRFRLMISGCFSVIDDFNPGTIKLPTGFTSALETILKDGSTSGSKG